MHGEHRASFSPGSGRAPTSTSTPSAPQPPSPRRRSPASAARSAGSSTRASRSHCPTRLGRSWREPSSAATRLAAGRRRTPRSSLGQIERIVIIAAETPELRAAVERAALLAERTNRARDLANMPPNELNPHTLGEQAQALAGELDHLKVGRARAARDRQARHGRALGGRPGQPERAAPDRHALRPAVRDARRRATSASSARRSPSTRAGSR